jgi:uncharacterized membrane protein
MSIPTAPGRGSGAGSEQLTTCILNLKFVSKEIMHTIVGSFGLVTVAPFTAVIAERSLPKSHLPASWNKVKP